MSCFLIGDLVECYRGDSIFIFNKKEAKLALKDVAYIGLKGCEPGFIPKAIKETTLEDRVSKCQASELNEAVFSSRFIKRENQGMTK